MVKPSLPPSEQEVIDSFDVEFKRVDIDDEKVRNTIKKFYSEPNEYIRRHNLIAHYSNFNLKSVISHQRRLNCYLVFDGHVIGIYYTHKYRKPDLKNLPDLLISKLIRTSLKFDDILAFISFPFPSTSPSFPAHSS